MDEGLGFLGFRAGGGEPSAWAEMWISRRIFVQPHIRESVRPFVCGALYMISCVSVSLSLCRSDMVWRRGKEGEARRERQGN